MMWVCLGMMWALVSCEEPPKAWTHEGLILHFNSKGRYARFSNSQLIFGDSVGQGIKEKLGLDSADNKIYRKAAHTYYAEADSFIYYMYGVAVSDSVMKEVRIRTYKNRNFISDFQIIDLLKDEIIAYDYEFLDNEIIIVAANPSRRTHRTHLSIEDGYVVDHTIIPDTIYRRQDYGFVKGDEVRIYNDFATRTLKLEDRPYVLEGQVVEVYKERGFRPKMIVELNGDELLGYKYLGLGSYRNRTSKLDGLTNPTLIIPSGYPEYMVELREPPHPLRIRAYVEGK